eukprot:GEMP01099317.1.p1 GENE.GEMP01099317.1~~GEMP01099317.1.p1  ORF type:complete len:140 (+),score=20.87 GEMP01099317.1:286-705(+)
MYVLASPDHPLVVTRIKAMIHEGLVQSLVQVLAHDRDLEVGREAFIALTNALISGSEDQVAHIIGAGVMDPFANLLTLRDLWTVAKTLEAIEHILSMGGSLAHTEGYLGATHNTNMKKNVTCFLFNVSFCLTKLETTFH